MTTVKKSKLLPIIIIEGIFREEEISSVSAFKRPYLILCGY